METIIGTDIHTAAHFLQQQQLVAIPTETVYGLAANALNEAAVIKIFEAKNRPRFNPLIVHVASIDAISNYATLNETAILLAKAFMPGPFTLLLPKKDSIPHLITAGSDKVAIRIPQHPLALQLLQTLPFPLAAPSANVFGYVSPTTAQHVYKGLQGRIPYILDGGDCEVGVESTIVEVTDTHIILHRSGGITSEAMAAYTNLPIVQPSFTPTNAPITSGQLKSHYATHTPLFLGNVAHHITAAAGKRIAIISLNKMYEGVPPSQQYLLSPKGDIAEAAQQLFKVMRTIDELQYDCILAEIFPNEGVGKAINDRLQRAQAAYK